MIETVVEILIVLAAVVSSGLLLKKNPIKARKTFAISFVIAVGVVIAFVIAQFSVQFAVLEIAISYSPLDFLALLAIVYWVAFVSAKGAIFDRVIGE